MYLKKNTRAPARPFGNQSSSHFNRMWRTIFLEPCRLKIILPLSQVRRLSFVAIKTDPFLRSYLFLLLPSFSFLFTRPFRFLFYSSSFPSGLSVPFRLAMIKPYNVVTIFLFGPRRHSRVSLPLSVFWFLSALSALHPPRRTNGRTHTCRARLKKLLLLKGFKLRRLSTLLSYLYTLPPTHPPPLSLFPFLFCFSRKDGME